MKRLQNVWQNAAYNRTKHSVVVIYDVSYWFAHPKKPVLLSLLLVSNMLSCADNHSLFQSNLRLGNLLSITNPVFGRAENRASLFCHGSVPHCNCGAAFLLTEWASDVTKPIIMNSATSNVDEFPLFSNFFAVLKHNSSVNHGKIWLFN